MLKKIKPIIVVESALKRPAKKVKNACTHCKASHLSCGEERPCARCARKGLTCTDSEHRPAGHRAKRNKSTDSEFSNELSPASSPNNSPVGSFEGGSAFATSSEGVSLVDPPTESQDDDEFIQRAASGEFNHLLQSLQPELDALSHDPMPVSSIQDVKQENDEDISMSQDTADRLKSNAQLFSGRHLSNTELGISHLQATEKRLEQLMEISKSFTAVALPTLTSSTFGKVLDVNHAFSELTGVSKEKWLGGSMLPLDALTDATTEDFLQSHLSIISGQKPEQSLRSIVDVPNTNEIKGSTRCMLTVSYITDDKSSHQSLPSASIPEERFCGFVMNFTPLECY